MTGRITERHLPLAEQSFPGIGRFYRGMSRKPVTFLQLVWAYEAHQAQQNRPIEAVLRRRCRG